MKTIDQMMQEVDVPAVTVSAQGLISRVNKCFEKVFGWNVQEIVGKPLTAIIPKDLHDAHQLGFSRFLRTGKPTLLNQPLKLKAVTKEGRVFEAEHVITAEQQEGQWVFGATIRPTLTS